jgi:hypothetical protein
MRTPIVVMAMVLLIGSANIWAEPATLVSESICVDVDSGNLQNPSTNLDGTDIKPRVLFSVTLDFDGVLWIRLRFGEVRLSGSTLAGTASLVRVTSLEDGAVQLLDAVTIREWRWTSAYFNGDRVLVELLAHPGTGVNRLMIKEVIAGVPGDGIPISICGEDDRVEFNDPAVGRILPGYCTGFLIHTSEHCFLTAGHCAGSMDLIEFNVPPSDPILGTIQHPGPEDQYSIDPLSIQFNDGEVGDDWCYFGAFANSVTGLTPRQAQGAFFTIADAPVPDGTAIQVTGHGQDMDPPEDNFTSQTDIGTYDVLDGFDIQYNDLDTENGNSGSPVLHLELGAAIGIHTTGLCDLPLGANHGTAIQNPGLQAALASPQGICAGPVFDESISRAFTIGPPNPQPCEECEAVSRAFTIGPSPLCPWDIDGDGDVGVTDFLGLLGAWGANPGHPADFDEDGVVGVSDFLELLANWGPCP